MPRFQYACPLRWADQDAYQHVNNVQTLRLLEEARVALFFQAARTDGIATWEGELVVVRHEIDYRRPLLYRPEPVTIELWIDQIRSSSFRVGYVVRDETATYAEAVSVLAAYDKTAGRARRLTAEERAWLEKYTD